MSDTPSGEPPHPHSAPPAPGWWLASDGRYYPPEQAPWAPPVPSPPGYQPYGVPLAHGTNGLAIASLVLGIIWIYWIGSVLALVFGYVARRQIDASGGRQTGRGMATAGIVLGWIGVAAFVLTVAALFVFGGWDALYEVDSDPVNGVCDGERYWQDPDCV